MLEGNITLPTRNLEGNITLPTRNREGKAIPSGIPVSGQGRSLPCMRAGGYLATEKPYVNCLSARKLT